MAFQAAAAPPQETRETPKVWVQQSGNDVTVCVGDSKESQILLRIRADGSLCRVALCPTTAKRLGIQCTLSDRILDATGSC